MLILPNEEPKFCICRNMTSEEVKDKVCPVHAIKAYRWNRGVNPLFRNLGTRWG